MIDPAAAFLLAAGISVGAAIARWLTRGAAVAATIVGTAVLWGAGWGGGAMLLVFFLSGSLLSALRERRRRSSRGEAKSGPRDVMQVLANGLPGAVAALALAPPWPVTAVVGGAFAAAAADTWSTELGILSGRAPRLVTTLRRVPPGTSGGVTLPGLGAAFLGAVAVAVSATPFGLAPSLVPLVVGAGFSGALLDSYAGAILQGRFRCERCDVETECRLHECGTPTAPVRGFTWLTNDGVNLLATCWGAGSAFLWLSLRSA